MSKWEMVRLGDVGNFKSGGTPTRTKPEYFLGNIPWITTVALGRKYITETDAVEFISEDAVKSSATKIIEANSIMIGVRVGVGKISINKIPMCTSQDIISIENIDKNKFNKSFLVYCINTFQDHFNSKKRGATIQGINGAVLKSIKIPLPPLAIQQKIARTLDTAADLLTLRKQQLAELDVLIQSVFVEMFGDPVVNDKGWETGTIRDVVEDVKYGTSKPATEGGQYIYLRMNNITYEGHLDLTNLKYIDMPENEVEKYVVRKGDVLFNRTNSKELVGKTCVFDQEQEMIIAGYIIRIRVNKRVVPQFLSAVLNSKYGKVTLFGMCKSIIGQANINAQELQNIKLYIPPITIQTQFAAIVEKIEQQKALIQQAIDESQTLFDSLMSHYFD